mmetsp:Transcript_7223/g.28415  ORF Transcript_7223/g.28415 Transcript_7223/m.28415 type:complete len:426 (-) Transcript_7223:44-1321(-)
MNPRSSTVGFRIHVRAPLQPRHVHELHHVEHLRAAVAAVARESDSLVPSGGLVPSRRHHPHRVELRHRRRGRRRSAGGGNRSGRLQCVHGRAIYLDRAIVHDERRRGVGARVVCRARRGLRPSLLRALRPALDPVGPFASLGGGFLSLILVRLAHLASRRVVRVQRVPARVPVAVEVRDGLEARAPLAETHLRAAPHDVESPDVLAARVVPPAVDGDAGLAAVVDGASDGAAGGARGLETSGARARLDHLPVRDVRGRVRIVRREGRSLRGLARVRATGVGDGRPEARVLLLAIGGELLVVILRVVLFPGVREARERVMRRRGHVRHAHRPFPDRLELEARLSDGRDDSFAVLRVRSRASRGFDLRASRTRVRVRLQCACFRFVLVARDARLAHRGCFDGGHLSFALTRARLVSFARVPSGLASV